MAEAAHRRSATRVDIFFAGAVAYGDPAAACCNRIGMADLAVKNMRHDRDRRLLEATQNTSKAARCRSLAAMAASVCGPRRAATRAARHSTAAKATAMVWKKDGVSVRTISVSSATAASGDISLSVTATIRIPRSRA